MCVNKLAQIKREAVTDGPVHAALAILTTRQRAFVLGIMVQGLPASVAAVEAGYSSGNHASILMRNPNVVDAIAVMQQEYAKQLDIEMHDVQNGFLDAIEVGRATNNAMAMIAGWREIAKLHGMYTEKKEVKVSFEHPEALQEADTSVLLELVSSDVIEGELADVESEQG